METAAGAGIDTRERAFAAEVHALHRYLEGWLKGDVPESRGGPVRLVTALARAFRVVHPDGRCEDRAAVIRNFALAYASKPPDYRLVIADVRVRPIEHRSCIVTYTETHHGACTRPRISSAVLRQRPHGRAIEWLFLQETYVARPASEAAQRG